METKYEFRMVRKLCLPYTAGGVESSHTFHILLNSTIAYIHTNDIERIRLFILAYHK